MNSSGCRGCMPSWLNTPSIGQQRECAGDKEHSGTVNKSFHTGRERATWGWKQVVHHTISRGQMCAETDFMSPWSPPPTVRIQAEQTANSFSNNVMNIIFIKIWNCMFRVNNVDVHALYSMWLSLIEGIGVMIACNSKTDEQGYEVGSVCCSPLSYCIGKCKQS